MKEHPMLFRAPMVRALLAGTKTETRRLRQPRCGKGGRIWVRETWAVDESLDLVKPSDLAPGIDVQYLADGARTKPQRSFDRGKTRVSIFMPRWASRITLEVTHEPTPRRLQDITEDDARAEGFSSDPIPARIQGKLGTVAFFDPVRWYAALWCAINGEDSWLANPWVWRIPFRVIR